MKIEDITITPTGDLRQEIQCLFLRLDLSEIAVHSLQVAEIAIDLALRFGVDKSQAEQAGLLHDVGRAIPDDQKAKVCYENSIGVLAEEISHVGLLHQKLAPLVAQAVFGCKDGEVLRAIECHTTLRAGATNLDKVLFLADKLSWQRSVTSFHAALEEALKESLDAAALAYIESLLDSKPLVIHPWLLAAKASLQNMS